MPDDQNTFKAVVEAEEQRRLELLNSIRTNIAEDLKHDETETCARRSLGDMNFIALVPLVKQALEIIRMLADRPNEIVEARSKDYGPFRFVSRQTPTQVV